MKKRSRFGYKTADSTNPTEHVYLSVLAVIEFLHLLLGLGSCSNILVETNIFQYLLPLTLFAVPDMSSTRLTRSRCTKDEFRSGSCEARQEPSRT